MVPWYGECNATPDCPTSSFSDLELARDCWPKFQRDFGEFRLTNTTSSHLGRKTAEFGRASILYHFLYHGHLEVREQLLSCTRKVVIERIEWVIRRRRFAELREERERKSDLIGNISTASASIQNLEQLPRSSSHTNCHAHLRSSSYQIDLRCYSIPKVHRITLI